MKNIKKTYRKKWCCILLAILIVVSCAQPYKVSAAKNDFVILNGVLKQYLGSASKVTIPANVIEIGDSAFDHCNSLKEVVIPSTVKTIGSDAFYACANLKKVTIKKGVRA